VEAHALIPCLNSVVELILVFAEVFQHEVLLVIHGIFKKRVNQECGPNMLGGECEAKLPSRGGLVGT
jgi:hypothetical protein